MTEESTEVSTEPPFATLELHRGPGWWYGALGLGLLVLGLVIPVSYLLAGRWVFAALCGIPLLGLGVLLGRLGLSIVRTRLIADQSGLRGRTPEGHLVNVGWDALTLDAAEGWLRLVVGKETLRLSDDGWNGFWDFVVLVYQVPAAARRVTPAARSLLLALLAPVTP